MRFIILHENLKEGLNNIERIIGKNLTLPILNNVLIETENSFLKLSATDLEIGITHWILTKIEEEGGIAIPAKFLTSFINSLPKEKIIFAKKDLLLDVECQNYKATIKGFSRDDFPIIPQIKEGDQVELESELFFEGLAQIASIPVLSQARPEISGIYISFTKEMIKMVATDSFRLAEKSLSVDYPLEKEYSFIIPQKTGYELLQILSDKKGKLKIYFGPDQIMFEIPMVNVQHPQTRLVSRLIEGEYPNYQEVIPQKYETQAILSKEEFLNQIRVASLFSGKINDVKIKADPKTETIEISAQNPELGENKSSISGKIKGEKQEVSFNYKFLIDGLLNLKSSEVNFELNGEDGPGVLKPVGDTSYLYVVMPIRAS
ncbi:MAG: DNA polymerase III subunit beta [Candidatus Nealsonbacteria bacterium CG23_combo_of_CG06-09_8_20_14_all_36_12]|uniref:Beta sliding clamp n=2 Tax=Candidatus Nealsoniibacteriota TaxID=1817911 RepID=A0A2H0TL15_9BACT|nr:MAG: DNA polymerase III subunit beta [Candidatus Nealsonbacteria bacterium CG23_combo_of_CG06-09_8_20_14_all_36_12]PIR72843.1 MAG: DNA polymerase III subunit beta [Candidatus Nealsonbacteria bacterium CG10_big_fil_rev_8_21_14_0_10_36_23]